MLYVMLLFVVIILLEFVDAPQKLFDSSTLSVTGAEVEKPALDSTDKSNVEPITRPSASQRSLYSKSDSKRSSIGHFDPEDL